MRWAVLLLLALPSAHAAAAATADYDGSDGDHSYAWGSPAWFPAADGHLHLAWTLTTDGRTFWVDPDGTPLAAGTRTDAAYDPEDEGALSTVVANYEPGDITRTRIDLTPDDAPCAALIRPGMGELPHRCLIADKSVPAATPIVTGDEAMVGAVTVVWTAGWPAQVAYGTAWERFAAGTPLQEGPAAASADGPRWETSPARPWGPDEAGIDLAWSRQDAYELALTWPTLLPLQQWLAERPEVWPQAGDAYVVDDGMQRLEGWTFTLTDGTEAFRFGIRRETHTGTVDTTIYDAPEPIPLSAFDDPWPTVDALAQRLRFHADPDWTDVTPSSWSYAWSEARGWTFTVVHDMSRIDDRNAWYHEEAALTILRDGTAVSFTDLSPRGQTGFSYAAATGDPAPIAAATPQTPDEVHQTAWIAAGATVGLAALLRWLVAPLFTRVRRDRALDHPRRKAIHAAIEASPGIHLGELLRVTGLANGAAMHHLRILEQAGFIDVMRGPGYTTYTATGAGARWRRFLPLLRSSAARDLVAILGTGEATIADLARQVGASATSVRWHLDRMLDAGLVVRERAGSAYRYRLASEAEPLRSHLRT